MAFREVRIREARNKLVFRFDPERDMIEVILHGERHYIALGDYRPFAQRRDRDTIGIDFAHIAGEEHSHG